MTDNANLDSLWDKYYGPDIVSSVEDGLVNIDDPLDILIQSLDFEENDMISGVGDSVVRNYLPLPLRTVLPWLDFLRQSWCPLSWKMMTLSLTPVSSLQE